VPKGQPPWRPAESVEWSESTRASVEGGRRTPRQHQKGKDNTAGEGGHNWSIPHRELPARTCVGERSKGMLGPAPPAAKGWRGMDGAMETALATSCWHKGEGCIDGAEHRVERAAGNVPTVEEPVFCTSQRRARPGGKGGIDSIKRRWRRTTTPIQQHESAECVPGDRNNGELKGADTSDG
jgi:hypothetical protein